MGKKKGKNVLIAMFGSWSLQILTVPSKNINKDHVG